MSSILPRDSPRHRRVRAPKPVARTASEILFGTIKNIVNAPFSWISGHNDFEDTPGKRRRAPQTSNRDEREQDGGEGRAKKKRVYSPEPNPQSFQPSQHSQETKFTSPYLDMPENMVRPSGRLGQKAPSHARSASLAVPSRHEPRFGRASHSPSHRPQKIQASTIGRTQSMDPPALRMPSIVEPRPISRDISMETISRSSSTRDITMSPTRTEFAMRPHSSLTPQPSGQAFGPTPVRRERDPSDPPPLQALMSKPIFVKPPPVSQRQETQQHSTQTLGSLVEAQKSNHSQVRQHSALLFGSRAPSASEMSPSDSYLRPINAAEKALHDLDVYKTPLLPSRLRGSTTIPEMFQPKKAKVPAFLKKDKAEKPRLGMADKVKDKDVQTDEKDTGGLKPYSGQGGMKKLLARRRKEEEEERDPMRGMSEEREQDEAAELQRIAVASKAELEASLNTLPAVSEFTPRHATGREQSSLRVGRSKDRSRHAPSVQISRPKNKFSAVYDDDEDDQMLGDDDPTVEKTKSFGAPPPPAPKFEVPAGFSFAKDVSPIKHDTKDAKEPPIAVLPFSLSKPAASMHVPFSGGKVTDESRAIGAAGGASSVAAPALSAPVVSSVPSISFTPASPGVSIFGVASSKLTESKETTTTTPSIPNFFANSSIFSKPTVEIPPPPVFSSIPALQPSASISEKTETQSQPKGDTGNASPSVPISALGAPASQTKPSPFGGFNQPNSISPFGLAANNAPTSAFGAKTDSAAVTSLFGGPAPGKEASAVPPTSLFGVPAAQSTNAPTTAGTFAFGTPTLQKPSEETGSATVTVAAAAKPAESASMFGAQKPDAVPEAKPAETASTSALQPSLFGAASSTSPSPSPSSFSGFGMPASTEAPKAAFSFGQRTQTTAASSDAPVVEAPKPSPGPGPFSFGQSNAAPVPPATTPVKSPFSFGAPPSTPPATTADKPAFSFGAPTSMAPLSLFGGAPSGSNGADVSSKPFTFGAPSSGSNGADVSSKPFAFGNSAVSSRNVTPPRTDQEVNMDESPIRGAGMDVNGAEKPSTNGFSFGGTGTSLFGQNNQSTASISSPFSFGSGTAASNTFGAKTQAKPDVKVEPAFGGFGQTTSTGFSFGQKAPETIQSPASPFGSTPFGQPSTTPTTASTGAFSFGAPSAGTSAFNRPTSASGSTPSSPSTFNQPTAFNFGTPTSATAPSNPFTFGSQPVSPANATAGLPQLSTVTNTPFTFGQPSSAVTQSPASPFGAQAAVPPGETPLFTIGAASAPNVGPGGRAMKKLPARRGQKR